MKKILLILLLAVSFISFSQGHKRSLLMNNNSSSTYLLDTNGGASAAYSLRYLSSAFVGSDVVLVRRDSDNTELGFTPTEITDGTLTTWVGAGNNGFITTWYDQSGNLKNAFENDNSRQPVLVNSGVLNLDDGKPYFNYLTTQFNGLESTGVNLNSTNGSLFCTYNSNDANSGVLLSSYNVLNVFIGIFQNGVTTATQLNSGSPDYYVNGSLISPINRDILYDDIVINQDVIVSSFNIDFSNSNWTNIIPFCYPQSTFTQNSKIKEMIIYNSDQTANKAGIESNINAYYTIY